MNVDHSEQESLTLAGPLEELRERLDDIVDRERTALSFKAEEDARMREAFLDALPPDVPGRINGSSRTTGSSIPRRSGRSTS